MYAPSKRMYAFAHHCIHSSMHSCVHMCTHTYIRTHVHTYIHTCIHMLIDLTSGGSSYTYASPTPKHIHGGNGRHTASLSTGSKAKRRATNHSLSGVSRNARHSTSFLHSKSQSQSQSQAQARSPGGRPDPRPKKKIFHMLPSTLSLQPSAQR